MNIEEWLASFTGSWVKHDIQKILSLFSEDVEYWETPHKLLRSIDELRHEWEAINNQKEIKIKTAIFSSTSDSHAVIWDLKYVDEKNEIQQWSGTYLIKLNAQGTCSYFHHTGERKLP